MLRGKQCPVGCRASQYGSDRPLYNTDYLLYWNYSDGTTKQFPVSSPAYIISAVLDGSDVLYVDYEAVDSGLKWSLIRSTDTGKNTLASGQAASYDQVPVLFCLNGQPMYLQSEDTGISVYHVDLVLFQRA